MCMSLAIVLANMSMALPDPHLPIQKDICYDMLSDGVCSQVNLLPSQKYTCMHTDTS